MENPNPECFAMIDGKPYGAWEMIDGAIMAGTYAYGSDWFSGGYYLTRVDGCQCYVLASNLRPATTYDIESACQWFAHIGK